MEDKELIRKIKKLRNVKPDKDWVFFAKNEVLGVDNYTENKLQFIEVLRFLTGRKLAYAVLGILFVFIGTFGFSQKTVPGDTLFSLRKTTERTQSMFVSGENRIKFDIQLVNNRLDDLTKIVQSQQEKKIQPAIEELKATSSQAARSLELAGENKEDLKDIAFIAKAYEENKKKAESAFEVLGALSANTENTEELDNAFASIVQGQIEGLEGIILTQEQEEILEEAKTDYDEKNYSEALMKILRISEE